MVGTHTDKLEIGNFSGFQTASDRLNITLPSWKLNSGVYLLQKVFYSIHYNYGMLALVALCYNDMLLDRPFSCSTQSQVRTLLETINMINLAHILHITHFQLFEGSQVPSLSCFSL